MHEQSKQAAKDYEEAQIDAIDRNDELNREVKMLRRILKETKNDLKEFEKRTAEQQASEEQESWSDPNMNVFWI